DADDLSTGCQSGVGDGSHEADVPAAVNKPELLPREQRAERIRRRNVFRPLAWSRPAKDTYPAHQDIAPFSEGDDPLWLPYASGCGFQASLPSLSCGEHAKSPLFRP